MSYTNDQLKQIKIVTAPKKLTVLDIKNLLGIDGIVGGGNADLTSVVTGTTIVINSATGTDVTLSASVSSAANGSGGSAGIVRAADMYRISNAILDIGTTTDISAGFSNGTNPITKTASLFLVNNAVTNEKLADMNAYTIKGNNTDTAGNPKDLTKAQMGVMLSVITGSGSPEGVFPSPVGTIFLRTNGGANTTLYVKESGTGDTGWIAK